MNTTETLRHIEAGDEVAFEINGRPALYEGVVTSVGPTAMTVRLDASRRMGVRFESIDGITVTREHGNRRAF